MANIFKAYDVRGIYPEELNKELAFKIGGAAVKVLKAKTLVVGEDARNSSPILRGSVVDAITRAGCNVYYIGPCTTPLFYYSVNKLKAHGGIMVTASHNPPEYGGLKIVGSESRPVGTETGLKDIERLSADNLESARDGGSVEEVNFIDDYVDFAVKASTFDPKKAADLRIIIDASNGMTPVVVEPLMKKLNLKYERLYFEIDGNFPNHSSDISRPEALDDLRKKVLSQKADLGIAFDGDGDRVMFIDSEGTTIQGEFILALLFKDMNGFFKKPKAVYDIRVSKSIKELLGAQGLKCRPGHSFIKKVMRDNDADVGGELSGHFFFKEMQYAESSILAMLKILKIISESGKTLAELVKPLRPYHHSGEINIKITDRDQAGTILQKLKEKYGHGEIDETDGVTIDFWNKEKWWFNVRPSNTEPLLRLVVEADTQELMNQKVEELRGQINGPA